MSENKRALVLSIDCGEETCFREPKKCCAFLRASHFGQLWECAIWPDETLGETAGGWLKRCQSCMDHEA